MPNGKGEIKSCGHYCENHRGICCRCTNPSNDMMYMKWKKHCKICRGVLIKHPDGVRTQRCVRCKKVSVTHYQGYPLLTPSFVCDCEPKTQPTMQEWAEPQKLHEFQNAENKAKYTIDE